MTMGKAKILVIDDEKIVVASLRKVLESEGFQVDEALRGREGIKMAEKKPYDLVITDIRMPDVGGLLVLRDVKRARPSVPVVILTGYATISSALQAMKLGAADYLEKPVAPDELIARISAAMDAARGRAGENQVITNQEEVRKVIRRGISDAEFTRRLLYEGSDLLDGYDLTIPEKLAIITGDVPFIESFLGGLANDERQWLMARAGAEVW
ncbi:MAG: response regulator [Thermodesulfobacteriota bacterium]